MKGLVVYHTKFGNCKKIAERITQGLEEAGQEVTLIDSSTHKVGSEFEFLASGSGTRAGRMTGSMRRFIRREIKKRAWEGKTFLAFGTGVKPEGTGKKTDKWAARGAEKIYEALKARGLKPVGPAAKFYVLDIKGPLDEGEEDRADERVDDGEEDADGDDATRHGQQRLVLADTARSRPGQTDEREDEQRGHEREDVDEHLDDERADAAARVRG